MNIMTNLRYPVTNFEKKVSLFFKDKMDILIPEIVPCRTKSRMRIIRNGTLLRYHRPDMC
jgi:hypothetical protein